MVADIGTKALTATRLSFLKDLMGMGKLCSSTEVEEMSGEKKDEVERKEGKKHGQQANKELKRLAEATQVLQLITLAATISVSKAEGEESKEDEVFPFEMLVIYTILVIFFTLVAQRFLDAAVRGAGFVMR